MRPVSSVRARSTGIATSRSCVLRDDEVTEPYERDPEAVATLHPAARVGDGTASAHRRAGSRRRSLSRRRGATEFGQRHPLRAGLGERSSSDQRPLDALDPISIVRAHQCSAIPNRRAMRRTLLARFGPVSEIDSRPRGYASIGITEPCLPLPNNAGPSVRRDPTRSPAKLARRQLLARRATARGHRACSGRRRRLAHRGADDADRARRLHRTARGSSSARAASSPSRRTSSSRGSRPSRGSTRLGIALHAAPWFTSRARAAGSRARAVARASSPAIAPGASGSTVRDDLSSSGSRSAPRERERLGALAQRRHHARSRARSRLAAGQRDLTCSRASTRRLSGAAPSPPA